jgi:hypothetical protein
MKMWVKLRSISDTVIYEIHPPYQKVVLRSVTFAIRITNAKGAVINLKLRHI